MQPTAQAVGKSGKRTSPVGGGRVVLTQIRKCGEKWRRERESRSDGTRTHARAPSRRDPCLIFNTGF